MSPEVRAALEVSIKHWEENVAADDVGTIQVYGKACALCQLFDEEYRPDDPEEEWAPRCYNTSHGRCPVFTQTGKDECGGSPWSAARDALNDWEGFSLDVQKKEAWRTAAQAELDFLKSLLPPKARP